MTPGAVARSRSPTRRTCTTSGRIQLVCRVGPVLLVLSIGICGRLLVLCRRPVSRSSRRRGTVRHRQGRPHGLAAPDSGPAPAGGECVDHLQTAAPYGVHVVGLNLRQVGGSIGHGDPHDRAQPPHRQQARGAGVFDRVGHQLDRDQQQGVGVLFVQAPALCLLADGGADLSQRFAEASTCQLATTRCSGRDRLGR